MTINFPEVNRRVAVEVMLWKFNHGHPYPWSDHYRVYENNRRGVFHFASNPMEAKAMLMFLKKRLVWAESPNWDNGEYEEHILEHPIFMEAIRLLDKEAIKNPKDAYVVSSVLLRALEEGLTLKEVLDDERDVFPWEEHAVVCLLHWTEDAERAF